MRSSLKTVALLLCAVIAGNSLAAPSPWDSWRSGYTTSSRAEQQLERGNYTAALALFEESKKHYLAVRSSRPDWNQQVIAERITECDRRILHIRRLLGKGKTPAAPVSPAQRPVPGRTPAAPAAPAAPGETARLRRQLAAAQAEIETLKKNQSSRSNFEREITNLMRDRRVLQEKYSLLEERCRKLENELAAPNARNNELQQQLVQERLALEELRKRAADSDKELAAMREDLRTNRLARSAAEKVLQKFREENDRRQKNLDELQNRFTAAQNRIRELAAEVESFRNKDGKSTVSIAEREAQIASLTAANTTLREQLADAGQQLKTGRDNIAAIKVEFTKLDAEYRRTRDELSKLRKINTALEKNVSQLSKNNTALAKRLETRDSEDFRSAAEARETCRKLEKDLHTLQNELISIRNTSTTAQNRITELERQLKSANDEAAALRLKISDSNTAAQIDRQELERFRNLENEYNTLRNNFEALARENRENRALAEAAKPREAELSRVKLRLLELDRLKGELVREQQFNEDLRAESRRLNAEVKTLRQRSAALTSAQRRIAELEGVAKELERLRAMQKDLNRIAAREKEFAELKIKTSELEQQLANANAQLADLTKKLSSASASSAELSGKLGNMDSLHRRNQELSEMVAQQSRELEVVNKRLVVLTSGKQKAIHEEYQQQMDVLRHAANQIGPLNDKLSRLAAEHKSLQKKFNERVAQLSGQLEISENLSRNKDTEIKRLRKLNSELTELKNNSADNIRRKSDQAMLDRLQSEISALTQLHADLAADRDRIAAELDAVRRGVNPAEITVKNPDSPEELAATGLEAERNANFELAIWNYRQALQIDPDFQPANLRLGNLLFARREYAAALPHLSSARSGDPENLNLALQTARCHIALQRFGNARAIILPLLRKFPENHKVQFYAGLIENGSGSTARAEEFMITAARLNPADHEPLIELARLRANAVTDRKGEAVEVYEQARIAGAPPEPELEKKLHDLLDKRREMIRFLSGAAAEAELSGDFGSAVWYYRKLLELNRKEFVPHLALALHRQKHSAAAREVLEFNPPSRNSMVVLTIIEEESGNETAALRAARQTAGAVLPDNWSAMQLELEKFRRINRPSAAIRMLLANFDKQGKK